MLTGPGPAGRPILKNPLIYSSAAAAAVLLAVVFTLLSRWLNVRSIERAAAAQRQEQQREQDRVTVEQLGGKSFDILMFYASPRAIERGASAKLCYGVSNAKSLTLEPGSYAVWPSASHCVDVSPRKTTTYTLTILDQAGHRKSQTVDLVVR